MSLVVLLLLGTRIVDRVAFADWYAEFAIQNLPSGFTSFAPTESLTGAYLFCVRRVVKEVTESHSVETFPASTPRNTVALGGGRYRVDTYVYEDRVDGERVKRYFTCTTRFSAGRWTLESLSLGSYARAD